MDECQAILAFLRFVRADNRRFFPAQTHIAAIVLKVNISISNRSCVAYFVYDVQWIELVEVVKNKIK